MQDHSQCLTRVNWSASKWLGNRTPNYAGMCRDLPNGRSQMPTCERPQVVVVAALCRDMPHYSEKRVIGLEPTTFTLAT